jgi:hypothetical protein
MTPAIDSAGQLPASSGPGSASETYRTERTGDLVVQRLVAIVGMGRIVEGIEIQVLAAAFKTEQIVSSKELGFIAA